MDNIDNIDKLTPAERYYKNHLKAVSNYQKRHPDKMHIRNAKYYSKIKQEDHEQYLKILEDKKNYYQDNKEENLKKRKEYYDKNKDTIKEQKKLYYINVIKPKLLLKKQQQIL